MLLAIFLISIAVFVDATFAHNVFRNEERSVCMTDDCKEFARSIINSMNSSVDPCVDFYEYGCGKWSKGHPIPPGKNTWRYLMVAAEESMRKIKALLIEGPQNDDIPPVRTVKQWYKACMDTDNMERRGMQPFVSILSRIGGWPIIMAPNKWNENVYKWQMVDDYYANLKGSNMFHETRVAIYTGNSTELGAVIDVPDLPLATWLLNSEVIEEVENEVETETENGDEGERILNSRRKFDKNGKYWKLIMSVISALAEATGFKISEDKVDKDVEDLLDFQWKLDKLTYLMDTKVNMTLKDFQKWYDDLKPHTENAKVNWTRKILSIFRDAKVELDDNTIFRVASPEYFKNLASLLTQTPSRTIVNYLHWSFISRLIPRTTETMRKLFDNTTSASEEEDNTDGEPSRSEKCIEEAKMTDAIAYQYLKKYFVDGTLPLAFKVIDDIQTEIETEIESSNWADDEIKNLALQKLRTIKKIVAHPEWYNDPAIMNHYLDGLTIGSTYFENALALDRYYTLKDLRKLKYKDDREPWLVDPLTINAFYQSIGNSITITAVNLLKPFFSVRQTNTINYALTGYLLAHEMYHAFDQQRHLLNEHGKEIAWTRDMTKKYNESTQCFVKQFNSYTLDGTPSGPKIEDYGNQTLEENMPDTMGLRAAFKAYKLREKMNRKPEMALPGLEMFSNNQLFFLSFTNLWCENFKPELLVTLAKLDMHSTGRLRTIGTLSNNVDFAKAFNCPLGSPMNPEKKCNIWKL